MSPSQRRPRRARRAGGRLERLVFGVMGPPQVGDVNQPLTVVPDPSAALCGRCGRDWARHERVATASMTYLRCPASPA